MLEALYVFEIPMSLPIDARVPPERVERGQARCSRAPRRSGRSTRASRWPRRWCAAARSGQAIVSEARRRGVEAIVLAAEEPTRVRGGAILGGRGRARDRFVGETTRYVIEKAACTRDPHRGARRPDTVRRGRSAVAPIRRRLLCRVASMFVLIVGCGRVGSAIAHSMLAEGNEVSVLDEDPEAIALLDRGQADGLGGARRALHRGHGARDRRAAGGRDRAGRRLRGIHGRRQHEPRGRSDRQAPLRHRARGGAGARPRPGAAGTPEQGLQTVCPTQTAIELLEAAVRGQIRFEGVSG